MFGVCSFHCTAWLQYKTLYCSNYNLFVVDHPHGVQRRHCSRRLHHYCRAIIFVVVSAIAVVQSAFNRRHRAFPLYLLSRKKKKKQHSFTIQNVFSIFIWIKITFWRNFKLSQPISYKSFAFCLHRKCQFHFEMFCEFYYCFFFLLCCNSLFGFFIFDLFISFPYANMSHHFPQRNI